MIVYEVIFLSSSLKDFIRLETATLTGVRQALPEKSIVNLSYVFSGFPTEVWADPHLVGQDRIKTDLTSTGLRLAYDKSLGSDFEIQFTWRDIELDAERSGLTQQTQLGLSQTAAELLSREGNSCQFEIYST